MAIHSGLDGYCTKVKLMFKYQSGFSTSFSKGLSGSVDRIYFKWFGQKYFFFSFLSWIFLLTQVK